MKKTIFLKKNYFDLWRIEFYHAMNQEKVYQDQDQEEI